MRCASCGFENPEGMQFCEECGTTLVRVCPSCGQHVRPTAKFCGACGAALTSKAKGKRQKAKACPEPFDFAQDKLRRRGKSEDSKEKRKSQNSELGTQNSELTVAERRQLTVMFCDLVGSTALSEQLDPEELREVVRAYQETCTGEIGRYDGHIAQHLGDGLLVYFGYPAAHEDDAQRAVRAGLEIVAGLPRLNVQIQATVGARRRRAPTDQRSPLPPLQVRIGIHTGLVVVGEIGSADKREILALGETPNIAARAQGIAEPDTVVVSAATYRLVQGLFERQDLGLQQVKGLSTPLALYRVLHESGVQSRFEAAVTSGLTPLVGRAEELALLRRRWERVKEGEGQVVLLSGEPGIGKSRLLQELKEGVATEGVTRIEFRCSAYHQNSAFSPIIEHLQRLLQFAPPETPQAKLTKLQQALTAYRFPEADTLSLLAALLSLPHPEGAPPITLSAQKQKQKTQEAIVAWMVEEADKAPVYCAWEDLHWADPSTVEMLALFLDQVPTTRLLALLTFRPEFIPPWGNRSHLSQMTLSRLGRSQVEAMVQQVMGGKALPSEVVQQIVSKTDGVPLFVEELTKTVMESGFDVGAQHAAPMSQLGIPTTLQDALMARLDRLGAAKEIAQLGATIGREFSYELLQTVFPLDEATLQHGLKQLVAAELIYQRRLLPQAYYLFKHALVQDVAYQSLLKSRRQQLHRQIAQVLQEQFPATTEAQPELLAHHYTEAGLIAQAIPYWQRAGQRAVQRSANVEAINHLTKELELFKTLPDTPERAQQELTLQITLGPALIAIKGYAAPEVEKVYTRARELCRQMGETPQLFSVLRGLWVFYLVSGELQTAHKLGEQLLSLAQSAQDPALLLEAHWTLGNTLFLLGELLLARGHLEQGIALCALQQHRSHAVRYGQDPGVSSLGFTASLLWLLGYSDQALKRNNEALALAQELSHPYSLAFALLFAAWFHHFRREGQAIQERAEAVSALATEQGFPVWMAWGTILRGWALAEQGQGEKGIGQLRQGIAAREALAEEALGPYSLALLAEAYGKAGQAKEGLHVLAKALTVVDKTGERYYEAELYRLKGQLTLQQAGSRLQAVGLREKTEEDGFRLQAAGHREKTEEAEECFLRAIEIARRQQAKSLELRTVMSLSRLWQSQGKKAKARQMLAEIYGWFTEGFDTADLKEAKALLDELMEGP